MSKYSWIEDLVNEGQYEEAYVEYTKIIEENPKAYDAYFQRALVDCYFLRKHYETSEKDLKLVFFKNKKLAKRIPMFLTIICDTLKHYDDAIFFGELALKPEYYTPTENLSEVYFALSRSYYIRGSSIEDYTNALAAVEECLKINEEMHDELLLCKCDILLVLENFDEVLEIVNHLFFTSKITPVLYYFKARAVYGKANNDQDFIDALRTRNGNLNIILTLTDNLYTKNA